MRREVARFALPGPVMCGEVVQHDPERVVYVFEADIGAGVATYVLVNHGEGTADFSVLGRVDMSAVRAIVLAHDAGLAVGLRVGRRQVAGRVVAVMDALRSCAETGAIGGLDRATGGLDR